MTGTASNARGEMLQSLLHWINGYLRRELAQRSARAPRQIDYLQGLILRDEDIAAILSAPSVFGSVGDSGAQLELPGSPLQFLADALALSAVERHCLALSLIPE